MLRAARGARRAARGGRRAAVRGRARATTPTPRAHPPLIITPISPLCLRPRAPSDDDELTRIRATPEVARWWGKPPDNFPVGDDPGHTRLTIEVDGAVAGLIQFHEEDEPQYRHASIDLFLDPALHGRGLGTEALAQLVHHLIHDRGHDRITIDPATDNAPAIRCYEKVGFKRVGVMRHYEHLPDGTFRDGLLMDLLAGEERDPTNGG